MMKTRANRDSLRACVDAGHEHSTRAEVLCRMAAMIARLGRLRRCERPADIGFRGADVRCACVLVHAVGRMKLNFPEPAVCSSNGTATRSPLRRRTQRRLLDVPLRELDILDAIVHVYRPPAMAGIDVGRDRAGARLGRIPPAER